MRPSSTTPLAAILAVAATAVPQDWKGRARIDGRVIDEAGAPLAGATIAIDRAAGTSPGGPRLSSGADGRWVADGIAPGSWTLVARAPGRRPVRIGVHLPGESSWLGPLEIRLEKEGPPPKPVADPPAAEEPPPAGDVAAVQAALEAGRVGRARELLASLEPDGSATAVDFVEIGSAFLTAGATEEASACFGQALGLDPEHVPAHYHRALARLALGRHDEARADLEAVVELEPGGVLAARAREALDALERGGG
jgi:hypothetical protein